MVPKNVKCKRFIAGLYKNTKNKQCPCYPKMGNVGTYLYKRDVPTSFEQVDSLAFCSILYKTNIKQKNNLACLIKSQRINRDLLKGPLKLKIQISDKFD